jgi:hypothetical protein
MMKKSTWGMSAMSEKTKVEARMFNPFENFTGRLDKEFQCKPVNVEYSCGNCCKKAEGGILSLIGKDFIELTADDDSIDVFTFVAGVDKPFKQSVREILIPLDNICSIQRAAKKKRDDY